MIRRPPRSTLDRSSAASDVYKRQSLHRVHITSNNDPFPLFTACINLRVVQDYCCRHSKCIRCCHLSGRSLDRTGFSHLMQRSLWLAEGFGSVSKNFVGERGISFSIGGNGSIFFATFCSFDLLEGHNEYALCLHSLWSRMQ
eukprot:TRINITY_DN10197_c0_g1_i11.p1 TRINITY_DN10197_c0_g1~~TRINITY_DN10197_c0_g1_i11.p1  ORF type:complete len:149 (-),score=11.33 TRINITY_DN10197_c0_g1_i11:115-540(-)